MSIQDWLQRGKGWVDSGMEPWLVPLIVLLVALASFGLGRLSASESAQAAVAVTQMPLDAKARQMAAGGLVVASRSGSAYHFPWCGGADTIKEANKVWFKDQATARAAGYVPAKNCKGLK